MRALAGGWGASPRGLDAVTWASAGGCAARHRRVAGVARILAHRDRGRTVGGTRAPLQGAAARPRRSRRDPGRAAGGAACTLTGAAARAGIHVVPPGTTKTKSLGVPLSYQANAFV